jgi:hypothetical protein
MAEVAVRDPFGEFDLPEVQGGDQEDLELLNC